MKQTMKPCPRFKAMGFVMVKAKKLSRKIGRRVTQLESGEIRFSSQEARRAQDSDDSRAAARRTARQKCSKYCLVRDDVVATFSYLVARREPQKY